MMEGLAAAIIILAVLMGSWTFGAVISWILVAKNARIAKDTTQEGEKNANKG